MLLAGFVSSVNFLASGGLTLEMDYTEMVVEGSLVLAPCDTPAYHWLGGFKKGVGFSYKGCRRCSASKYDLKRQF